MKILTHAEDCTNPADEIDPLDCPCAGDYTHYDSLDDLLDDRYIFECHWCKRTVDSEADCAGDAVAILWPWEELKFVFCSTEHRTAHEESLRVGKSAAGAT